MFSNRPAEQASGMKSNRKYRGTIFGCIGRSLPSKRRRAATHVERVEACCAARHHIHFCCTKWGSGRRIEGDLSFGGNPTFENRLFMRSCVTGNERGAFAIRRRRKGARRNRFTPPPSFTPPPNRCKSRKIGKNSSFPQKREPNF